jgi:hypothetical protein
MTSVDASAARVHRVAVELVALGSPGTTRARHALGSTKTAVPYASTSVMPAMTSVAS